MKKVKKNNGEVGEVPGNIKAPKKTRECGNGPFKPVVSSTTHQPMGWDQMAALYNSYYCVSSSIKVTWAAGGATAASSYVGVIPVLDGTIPGAYTNLIEMPQCHYKSLGTESGGRPIAVTTHAASTKKMFHVKYVQDADECVSLVTANPTLLWYWLIFSKANGTTDPDAMVQQIEIEYNCVFISPKTLQQS